MYIIHLIVNIIRCIKSNNAGGNDFSNNIACSTKYIARNTSDTHSVGDSS